MSRRLAGSSYTTQHTSGPKDHGVQGVRLPGRSVRDTWPCAYERHRPSDWRLREGHRSLFPGQAGRIVCGICHPPPFPEDEIERRSAIDAPS